MARSSRRWLLVLGGALLAGYFVTLSLVNLDFGRADNGDFTRLAGHWIAKPQGFAVNWPAAEDPEWSRRFFRCWLRSWERQPDPATAPPPPSDLGSTRFLWLIAFGLQRAFSSPEVFDLLYLGAVVRAVCLVLLLLFYALAAAHFRDRSVGVPLLIAAPLAAGLADPRLTTFYNSFYREAGSAPYALLAVCGLLALSGRRFWAPAALAAAGAGLLAQSASAHFFTALVMAAALGLAFLRRWWAAGSRDDKPGAAAAGWLGLAGLAGFVAVLLAAGFGSERQTDLGLRKNAAFHTLFHGALEVSGDPAGHLAYLGLPAEARKLIGSHAFGPDAARFIQENWNRFGHRAAAKVLLREPVLIPRMLRQGALVMLDADSALDMASDSACSGRTPRLAWWTAAKGRLMPEGYPLLALLAAAVLAGLAAVGSADPRVSSVGLALAFASLCALGEVGVAVFGDGFMELPRHMLTAGLFVDIVLALLIWLAVLVLAGRSRTDPEIRRSGDPRLTVPSLFVSLCVPRRPPVERRFTGRI